MVLLQAGNIDDKSWIKPSMAIYTKDMNRWIHHSEYAITYLEGSER